MIDGADHDGLLYDRAHARRVAAEIRAFMARAGEVGADQALTFLREVDAINMRRRQRAHLTVARTGTRTRDPWLLDDHAHALAVYTGPEFAADEVKLFESHLGRGRSGGPKYEVVDTFYLR